MKNFLCAKTELPPYCKFLSTFHQILPHFDTHEIMQTNLCVFLVPAGEEQNVAQSVRRTPCDAQPKQN